MASWRPSSVESVENRSYLLMIYRRWSKILYNMMLIPWSELIMFFAGSFEWIGVTYASSPFLSSHGPTQQVLDSNAPLEHEGLDLFQEVWDVFMRHMRHILGWFSQAGLGFVDLSSNHHSLLHHALPRSHGRGSNSKVRFQDSCGKPNHEMVRDGYGWLNPQAFLDISA